MTTITDYQEVAIPVCGVELHGHLQLLKDSKGIVLFAHGTASSRFSPRNNHVAEYLHEHNFSTLLFDLLTPNEYQVNGHRYNYKLMSDRLTATTEWIQQYPEANGLPIGIFGSCTGAASAFTTAANLKNNVKAIVSRGGRIDLVPDALEKIQASTLLIIGGLDTEVIEYNETAYPKLKCTKKMEIVEGATHLFPEEGALQKVSERAADWFDKHLN